ncbi:glycine/D-amino acid oxidase-like deaminating enzyme [Methylopila capsulata]|uniref:FAD-dependent oxidoreductase n=1 Tax=Methylopila capsulata TaxID=61654 RepID=A0A9W6IRK0_9HYPH|nr:FAD-dependent oxidoreductase [Methylopila capsulata]MBM7851011.1 glycine/D-amino acid oxidase-like deaminating enzyme [Methylopila capsulata]GLK54069.1 FAD-dependent oxidoreductase [Methylopila capsulata]
MRNDYDFAVLGGGLVGAATAYGLAKLGLKVLMLDEGDVAKRASRGNFALVWVQNKGLGMPAYATWTRRSSDAWVPFARELEDTAGFAIHHRRTGGYHLALTEDELARRAAMIARLHNQPGVAPSEVEVLDGDEIRRRLPEAGPEVAGGTFCPLDGDVNSLKLFRALHEGFARLGGTYRSEAMVDVIEPGAGGFALSTQAGRFSADRIVLAAGLGNARLGAMVGMTVPVRPVRGQLIVTEKTAPFLDAPVSTVRQTDEGGVMVGDSQEEADSYDGMRQGVMAVMADRAVRMFPRLGRLNVVRTWSALRVMSPDGFPIYDESPVHPGCFVATCHSGVTLAAAHAALFAPAIAAGSPPSEFDDFSLRRFHVSAAA